MENLILNVIGPLKVPTRSNGKGTKRIDEEAKTSFFSSATSKSVEGKQGCYIFALKGPNGGMLPWYVGKATRTFRQECFAPHKIEKYNGALFEKSKVAPYMFFVTTQGAKKKISAKICTELEYTLIQSAIIRNPELKNERNTTLAEWSIKGVLRSPQGKPSGVEKKFKSLMGI